MLLFYIDVPENATDLSIEISGGDGDADLYTRFEAEPTLNEYDCRPYLNGNRENCTEAAPDAGKWYIGLYGYEDFSGVSLTASYETEGSDPDPGPSGQCVTADNNTHISQGRASRCGILNWMACAVGSGDDLGWAVEYFEETTSVKETASNYWERVASCP
jgi:serine protease